MKRWRAVWLILVGLLFLLFSIRAQRMEAASQLSREHDRDRAVRTAPSPSGGIAKWVGLVAVVFGCGLLFRDLARSTDEQGS